MFSYPILVHKEWEEYFNCAGFSGCSIGHGQHFTQVERLEYWYNGFPFALQLSQGVRLCQFKVTPLPLFIVLLLLQHCCLAIGQKKMITVVPWNIYLIEHLFLFTIPECLFLQ